MAVLGWNVLETAAIDEQHQLVFSASHENTTLPGYDGASACGVPNDRRIDCGFLGINKDECERNGCCWSPVEGGNVPWCFNPVRLCQGYSVQEVSDTRTGKQNILDLFYLFYL